ncbi:endonuclease/exonuclease/phosphatase family protein [Geodermatophilus sp. SYSU D01119]
MLRAGPGPRPAWRRRTAAAAGVLGLAGTLALLAVLVVGDGTAVTYTLGLVSSWWLLPAPLVLLAALAARSWRAVAAALLPALACLLLQGPWLLHRVTVDEDAPADLRVVTWNVTAGTPPDGLARLLADTRPDVVLLQEIAVRSRAQVRALVPDGWSLWLSSAGGGRDGSAVLSRWPVTAVVPVEGLPDGARPADVVTVDAGGTPLSLLSVHLASPCYGGCARDEGAEPVSTGRAARLRVEEARRYAEVAAEAADDGRPFVLAGDLNSSPLNEPLRLLTGAGLTDVHAAVGTAPQLTRGPGPGLARIDAVLVTGLVPVRSAERDPGTSTHSPVVADLDWPEAPDR